MRCPILLVCLVATFALRVDVRAQASGHDHRAGGADSLVLGSVDFRNSGNAAAQAPLQRGVALLHSFAYGEAADAFAEAERADPSLAVAYWLEALTFSHVLWSEEYLPEARAALAKLGPDPASRLAKAKTPRERAFGAAVEAYYADAPRERRASAYADSLTALAMSDPADLEAGAFAAHARIVAAYVTTGEESRRHEAKAIELAARVFEANPDHPGAAHYLIHTADLDIANAAKQVAAARAYSRIAPDLEHALHMPSHVFLPLGMWSEVSAANERAWAASRAWNASRELPATELSWHALAWLQYSYLQEGRWREAKALVDTARALTAGVPIPDDAPDTRYVVSVLSFTYANETGDWNGWSLDRSAADILADAKPTPRASTMSLNAAYHAAVAALLARGDTLPPMAMATQLGAVADDWYGLARPYPNRLGVMLEALAARARGDTNRSIALLERIAPPATAGASTPPTVIPFNEQLGAVLLQAGRARHAVTAYEAALEERPNRSAALLGLARARRAAGDAAGAADAYRSLLANYAHADPGIGPLTEATTGAR
jgi:Tfp pilus assembly protein PilF